MPGCAIITCRQRSGTGVSSNNKKRVSFHRFPIEPDLKEKWINATGRGKKWFPTKLSTICSNHFSDSDFVVKKSGYRYLHLGAIPHENVVTVHSFTPSSTSHFVISEKHRNVQNGTIEVQKDEQKNLVNKIEEHGTNFSANNIIGFRQSTTHDQNIIKRQRLQIKKIQAQNRRLRKRLSKVEGMFNALKEKLDIRDDDDSICAIKNENEKIRDLMTRCISKKTRLPFSSALQSFAFTLHAISTEAYDYVCTSLDAGLPNKSTLGKCHPNTKDCGVLHFSEDPLLNEITVEDPLREISADPLEESLKSTLEESVETLKKSSYRGLKKSLGEDRHKAVEKVLEEVLITETHKPLEGSL